MGRVLRVLNEYEFYCYPYSHQFKLLHHCSSLPPPSPRPPVFIFIVIVNNNHDYLSRSTFFNSFTANSKNLLAFSRFHQLIHHPQHKYRTFMSHPYETQLCIVSNTAHRQRFCKYFSSLFSVGFCYVFVT